MPKKLSRISHLRKNKFVNDTFQLSFSKITSSINNLLLIACNLSNF